MFIIILGVMLNYLRNQFHLAAADAAANVGYIRRVKLN
jgi:hypothetical protein